MSAATIRPRPRTASTPGSSRSDSASSSAQLAHAREQRRVVEHVERGVRGGGDHGAAGERRAVVAGREHVGEPLAGDQRADRQPAASAFAIVIASGTTPVAS